MEYMCLIVQIFFILGIFIFRTNDGFLYIYMYDVYYKKYLIVELIVQGMCVVVNCVFIFIIKQLMPYVLVIQLVLMSLILDFYSRKAKKRYFTE